MRLIWKKDVEFETEKMMRQSMAHVLNLMDSDVLLYLRHAEENEEDEEQTYIITTYNLIFDSLGIFAIADKPDVSNVDINTVNGKN